MHCMLQRWEFSNLSVLHYMRSGRLHRQGSEFAAIYMPIRIHAHLAASRQSKLCHSSDADVHVLVLWNFQALRHQWKPASYMRNGIVPSATQRT